MRFEITHFVAHGNTLIPQPVVDALLAPYTGPGRDFGTVQQALETLEKAYAAAGFNAIQVLLPEQTLESGVVHFTVVESRLASIRIEGNTHFSSENYKRSLTSLEVGSTPNFDDLVDNLRLLNEHPGKQASVVMRAGANEGQLDAVVKASDQSPLRYALTFDNTGNESWGPIASAPRCNIRTCSTPTISSASRPSPRRASRTRSAFTVLAIRRRSIRRTASSARSSATRTSIPGR
ncbi:MAG: ShlB/FhaC/HecB family hemolysin secretion/activation protein [Sulfuritalea sp.]|nr:ShlB/FhaC/HecB family hemolysin secretion/activation protein [Sulfuritalea sp.]